MYPDCPCGASLCLERGEVGVPLQPAPLGHEPGHLTGTGRCRTPETLVPALAWHRKLGETHPLTGAGVQQAKDSATEPCVTNDERVTIYWENCPIKNTLKDPVSCLIPFKYSTIINPPYNYKLKKGVVVILPRAVWPMDSTNLRHHQRAVWVRQPSGAPPGRWWATSTRDKQSPLQTWATDLLPDPCSCREQRWRELCQ